MKIKHWQGYGCVNAKKMNEFRLVEFDGEYDVVEVLVWGNHEWGLTPYSYDDCIVGSWLGRFFKGKELVTYGVTDKGDHNGQEYALYRLFTREA